MVVILFYTSLHKNSSASDSNYKSTNKDECRRGEKKFGKNIKATFKVGAHHHKCCESKLDNSMYTCILNVWFNMIVEIFLDCLTNCFCKRQLYEWINKNKVPSWFGTNCTYWCKTPDYNNNYYS